MPFRLTRLVSRLRDSIDHEGVNCENYYRQRAAVTRHHYAIVWRLRQIRAFIDVRG